ncbi:MAG: amidohydrolase family protein [Balneolaceae bacterium]
MMKIIKDRADRWFYRCPVLLMLLLPLFLHSGCNTTVKLEPADLLIDNVQLVDVRNGNVIPDQSVLVHAGEIVAITDYDAGLAIGARDTLHADGLYLIPGLWDMHVHFRGGQELIQENERLIDLYLPHGITSIADMGGDIPEAVYSWREEIQNGERLGPNLYTTGPKLDGAGGGWDGSLAVENRQDATDALNQLEERDADAIKIYDGSLTDSAFRHILDEAGERGMRTIAHIPLSVTLEEALAGGLNSIQHLYYVVKACTPEEEEIARRYRDGETGFWQAVREMEEGWDENLAREVAEQLSREGTAVSPTLHIARTLFFLDRDDHSNDPLLDYIPAGIQETYAGRVNAAASRNEDYIAFQHRLFDIFRKMTLILHEAGVPLLAGSDAGPFNSYVYPGNGLHGELEELVNAGLTPLEALRTATMLPARFMDMEEETGTIASGKSADLVLLEANPLKNIRNTRRIAGVIRDGRYFDREELDKMLTAADPQ